MPKRPFKFLARKAGFEVTRDRETKETTVTYTLDANPKDGLDGVDIVITGAPNLKSIFKLFGGVKGLTQGRKRDEREDFKELAERSTHLEGEFIFAFDDGQLTYDGCYFCDDDGDGFAEGARKCTPTLTAARDVDEAGRLNIADLVLTALDTDVDAIA